MRHVYLRMDVDHTRAYIGIELRHLDEAMRHQLFTQLQQLKRMLENSTGEEWDWQPGQMDDDGRIINRVSKTLNGVNIFNEADWPLIISFLKPRIIAFDEFWTMVKDSFE